MKGRSDPSTPLSAKLESVNSRTSIGKTELIFESFDESEQEEYEIEEEMVQEPPEKRPRKSYPAKTLRNDQKTPAQTIQYIIQDDSADISNEHEQILEIQPERIQEKVTNRYKKRSKGFGKYVASLMQDITDDKVFFETQTEILKIIEKATLKSPAK
jgi:hypothetical protein